MENSKEFNQFLENSKKGFEYNSEGKDWNKDLSEFYAYINAKLAFENNQILIRIENNK